MPKQEKCVCIQLRRSARAVTSFYDGMLAPAGVTVNQYSLLANLRKLGVGSVSALAQRMKLERSTLVRSLKPLISAGLVGDAAKPGTRDRALSLTEAGEGVYSHAKKLWKKAQDTMEQALGAKNLRAMMKTLAKLEAMGGNQNDV